MWHVTLKYMEALITRQCYGHARDMTMANALSKIDRRSDRGCGIASENVHVRSDVRKFEFEFGNVRTSNVFNRFEIRRMF